MLTKKGKYGLKAMVHLAGAKPGEPMLVNEIAEQNGIPKKFLDTILGELRNAGLLHSKKGKGGGYSLGRPASEIRVGHIDPVMSSLVVNQQADNGDEARCKENEKAENRGQKQALEKAKLT